MAIGAVTDLGASDNNVSRDAPNAHATPMALSAAVAEPDKIATKISANERRTF